MFAKMPRCNNWGIKFDNPCNFIKRILRVIRAGIRNTFFSPVRQREKSNNSLKAFIFRSRISSTRDLRDFFLDQIRKNRKLNLIWAKGRRKDGFVFCERTDIGITEGKEIEKRWKDI